MHALPSNTEQLLHDDLIKLMECNLQLVYDDWKLKKEIDPYFLSWPSAPVRAADGSSLDGVCRLDLPKDDKAGWYQYMTQAIEMTNSYAIMLLEQHDDHVTMIFESWHGTRAWTLPIETDEDDSTYLGAPEARDNVQSIGFLWRPVRGQA